MKNTNAIEKIIASRSMRDYQSAERKLTSKQKLARAEGKFRFSYSLGTDTMEAIEIKRAYMSGTISEEDYKAYCLRQNLLEYAS